MHKPNTLTKLEPIDITNPNWVSARRTQPSSHSTGVNPIVRVQCAVVPSVKIPTHAFTSAARITARLHCISTHVDPTQAIIQTGWRFQPPGNSTCIAAHSRTPWSQIQEEALGNSHGARIHKGQLLVPADKHPRRRRRPQCTVLACTGPKLQTPHIQNGGRSQSTEHEAHAPYQHLLPLDPYIGQTLAPSSRVRRQTKVQPTIPNPHNPTMAAQVIPAHPLNIRITGRGLLLLRNTMQTARQVLRRQLQHPPSILLRARPHEDQPSSQTQPDPLHRPPGKAPLQHNPEVLLGTFPPALQRLHRPAVTKFSTPAAAAFPAFRHGKSTEHRENGEPCVSLKLIENTSQYQPPHRHHLARVLQQHPPELKRTETRPLHIRVEIGVQPTWRISRV